MTRFLFILCVTLISCSKYPESVNKVLELSGKNRTELESVLKHYINPSDSLKYKATVFLISNMIDKYGYYHENETSYKNIFKSVDSLKVNGASQDIIDTYIQQKLDENFRAFSFRGKKVMDYDTITSTFLIENIDLAFKVWKEKTWANHLSFDEFCEWLLPYRFYDEPLGNWRKDIYQELSWIEDSIKDKSTPDEITLYINTLLAKSFQFSNKLDQVPLLKTYDQFNLRAGVCKHRYLLVASSLRAMGVPIMEDLTPRSCKGNLIGHSWLVMLGKNNKLFSFNGGEVWANIRNPASCPLAESLPVTQIFRRKFAINENALVFKLPIKEIPRNLINPHYENVSSAYKGNLQGSIYLDLNEQYKDGDNLFLCVLGPQGQYIAVLNAFVKHNKIQFDHVGRDGIYFVGDFKTGKIEPVTHAFIFPKDSTKTIQFLEPNLQKTERIVAYRKYFVQYPMDVFSNNMVNDRIQGANKRDFSDAKDIYTIVYPPNEFKKYHINLDNSFKYFRYLSDDDKEIRVAEIGLYYTAQDSIEYPLKGKIWGNKNDHTSTDNTVFSNAFDKNIRTNFNAPAGSWSAIDVGKRVKLTSVAFLSRNHLNVIEPGDIYRLNYFDKKWIPIEKKTADNYSITFDNVPAEVPLLLQNLSKGKEEAIFLWQNNEQVFW